MPGNKQNASPAQYAGGRVERLLRDREIRKTQEGCEKSDGTPIRQRLLVVANRLPVSAVRRGEDSWSLEISAGGLVSALLGKQC